MLWHNYFYWCIILPDWITLFSAISFFTIGLSELNLLWYDTANVTLFSLQDVIVLSVDSNDISLINSYVPIVPELLIYNLILDTSPVPGSKFFICVNA